MHVKAEGKRRLSSPDDVMKGSVEVPSPPCFGVGSPVPEKIPLQVASPGIGFWPLSAGKGQGKLSHLKYTL